MTSPTFANLRTTSPQGVLDLNALLDTNSVLSGVMPGQAAAIRAGTSTNDTAAVNAAIAASVGRKLYFPAGTYMVDSSPNAMPWPTYGGLIIPSNTHLVLDPGATIKIIPNAYSKH